MRFFLVLTAACVSGCGGPEPAASGNGSEVVVALPPASPAEPSAGPAPGFEPRPSGVPAKIVQPAPAEIEAESKAARVAKQADPDVQTQTGEPAQTDGQIGADGQVETIAASGQAETMRLLPARPSGAVAAWAGHIRRAGFECGDVASARQLQRESGDTLDIYRIQCSSGGTYQGTLRSGRLYFRKWTGQLVRR